jgi:hypothetical protein
MEDYQVVTAQENATFQVYQQRLKKAERSGPPSAQFAILQRFAIDALPLAEAAQKMAQAYATKTIELNPLVLSAARIGSSHPSGKLLFADLHDAVNLAYRNITDSDYRLKSGLSIDAEEWTADRAHLSRAMKKLYGIYSQYARTVKEANQIIRNWVEQLKWLS